MGESRKQEKGEQTTDRKRTGKIYHTNTNQKEAEVTISMSKSRFQRK